MSQPANESDVVTIRPATLADVQAIADFNLQMAWETESLKLDPATLHAGVAAVVADDRRGHYFVAEVDGRVMGCLLVTHEWSDWRNGDMWWIQSVYVHADARRKGVFKSLAKDVERRARAAGACAIRLYVDRHNSRAKETYAKLGFALTDYDVMHRSL